MIETLVSESDCRLLEQIFLGLNQLLINEKVRHGISNKKFTKKTGISEAGIKYLEKNMFNVSQEIYGDRNLLVRQIEYFSDICNDLYDCQIDCHCFPTLVEYINSIKIGYDIYLLARKDKKFKKEFDSLFLSPDEFREANLTTFSIPYIKYATREFNTLRLETVLRMFGKKLSLVDIRNNGSKRKGIEINQNDKWFEKRKKMIDLHHSLEYKIEPLAVISLGVKKNDSIFNIDNSIVKQKLTNSDLVKYDDIMEAILMYGYIKFETAEDLARISHTSIDRINKILNGTCMATLSWMCKMVRKCYGVPYRIHFNTISELHKFVTNKMINIEGLKIALSSYIEELEMDYKGAGKEELVGMDYDYVNAIEELTLHDYSVIDNFINSDFGEFNGLSEEDLFDISKILFDDCGRDVQKLNDMVRNYKVSSNGDNVSVFDILQKLKERSISAYSVSNYYKIPYYDILLNHRYMYQPIHGIFNEEATILKKFNQKIVLNYKPLNTISYLNYSNESTHSIYWKKLLDLLMLDVEFTIEKI